MPHQCSYYCQGEVHADVVLADCTAAVLAPLATKDYARSGKRVLCLRPALEARRDIWQWSSAKTCLHNGRSRPSRPSDITAEHSAFLILWCQDGNAEETA